jgi:plastocyanin
MRTLLIVIVLLVVLAGGFWWYTAQTNDVTVNVSGDTPPVTPTPTPSPTPTTTPQGTTPTSAAVKEFTVTSTGVAFNQKTLSVNKGDRVRITYSNGGGTHDLRIDGYNVGTKVIQGGQKETFEFVADKAGTFEYYCSVGQHRQMGMKGTLTVK